MENNNLDPFGHLTQEQKAELLNLTHDDIVEMARLFPGDWHTAHEMSGTRLMGQEFPKPTWLIPGVLPTGYTIVAAPPKTGKSWLMLDLAANVSTGGKTLGHYKLDHARPVLYLALEDTFKRLQDRLKILEYKGSDNLTVRISLNGEEYEPVLKRWLETRLEQQPLIIVDTLGKIRPPGEMSYQADYAFSAALKTLIDPINGASLIAVHHTRQRQLGQPSGDFLEAVSGTSGLTGAADTVAVLSRERQETKATLAITGRDVEESELLLQFDNGQWCLDLQKPHGDPTPLNDPVAYVIKKNAAIFSDIRANSPDLTTEAILKRLKRAVDNGQLTNENSIYRRV